jgi:hypothetical protein
MDFIANRIRTYSYLTGVFASQQRDPFCRQCKAMVNSVVSARDGLARFETDHAGQIPLLPPDLRKHLADAKSALHGFVLPENAAGQKKAGNCKLPQGTCLIKASLAILQQL